MQCLKCNLKDTIDCIVFLPGKTTCARCGAEMTEEQRQEAQDFYPWGKEIDLKDLGYSD